MKINDKSTKWKKCKIHVSVSQSRKHINKPTENMYKELQNIKIEFNENKRTVNRSYDGLHTCIHT